MKISHWYCQGNHNNVYRIFLQNYWPLFILDNMITMGIVHFKQIVIFQVSMQDSLNIYRSSKPDAAEELKKFTLSSPEQQFFDQCTAQHL